MQAMADDDDGTCKEGAGLPGLPALPDAGLPGAEEPADELNPLACAFRFYVIQESADEDGHTFGKVRPPELAHNTPRWPLLAPRPHRLHRRCCVR